MNTFLFTFSAVRTLCANWMLILFSKLTRFPVQEILMRDGTKFMNENGQIGRAELSILTEIWYEKVYTPPFFDIGPADIVVDIGSNTGTFTVLAAQRANKGHVFALEPVPELAQRIRQNVSANKLANVTVLPVALADKNGTEKFYLSSKNSARHSFSKRDEDAKIVEVKTISFASFCEQQAIGKIDFLKMDCEGAEYKIIPSMVAADFARIKKIAMEYHHFEPEQKPEPLIEILRKNNFIVAKHNGFLFGLNRAFIT